MGSRTGAQPHRVAQGCAVRKWRGIASTTNSSPVARPGAASRAGRRAIAARIPRHVGRRQLQPVGRADLHDEGVGAVAAVVAAQREHLVEVGSLAPRDGVEFGRRAPVDLARVAEVGLVASSSA